MKNILQYFEETCEQFPDHIAVANESSSVTFNDLKTRSQQAGTMIASELKQDSLPVAIYIDKSLALVEAMLSVLYSGNSCDREADKQDSVLVLLPVGEHSIQHPAVHDLCGAAD